MYRTRLHLKKRTGYGWLVLLLLIGVLLPSAIAVSTPEQVAWAEELVPWPSRHCSLASGRYWRRGLVLLVGRSKVLSCRLGLVAVLLVWSGWSQQEPWSWAVLSVPVAEVWLSLLFLWWPRMAQKPSYLYLVGGMHQLYLVLLTLLLGQGLTSEPDSGAGLMLIGGCVKMADGVQAQGGIDEEGTWHLELEGPVRISYKPGNEFEKRLLLFVFRQIRLPQSTAKHPFLRQSWLAEWFDTCQELISRWEKYVREGGVLKLLGEPERWVLTPQICRAILDIWVSNFWLSAAQVRERLVAEGHLAAVEDISEGNIYRVAQESGFAEVRRRLHQLFHFRTDGPQWREGGVVRRLFELNETLLARLEAIEGLSPQLTLEVVSLKQALGAPVTPLKKPLPYAYRLQQLLFGQWQDLKDGKVRCPHCGSTLVACKEHQPRRKKYRDPQTGEWQEAIGYRYYCRNPVCPWGTFTDYPDEVRLYSYWTVESMVWGVTVYMQMRTTYRRAAAAVGVSHVTLWRWAMLVGQQALPVTTLFGLVRCSGVVGVDEKWVLVPKNDKPAGKRQRWMYVYLAVDVYTYDLLHLDIYPYNGKDQARAFLQALRAKGYQPQVIITDMNQDYTDPIRQVFPLAQHHECVFHALQGAQRLIKKVYGHDYAQTHPEAEKLKKRIYKIFDAKTKRTVNKRYQQVMALKNQYVAQKSETNSIFDFLERHYPKLVNAVEHPLTPLTNNTVELVIRRFDQHYQNMCGFDSIETARAYLNLFELTYRFTPFVKDNRPVKGRQLDIRGKCPLELAGYDIGHMPIAQIMRAQILGWPPEIVQQLVPNT
jgi:transposase-like protein